MKEGRKKKKTGRSFKAKGEINLEGGVIVRDYTQTGAHRYGAT